MANELTDFGRPMLELHFPHIARKGVTMLNTGSFGVTPKCVLDKKIQIMEEFESFADQFVRLRQIGLNQKSLSCLTDRLGLRSSQCALIENVTVGLSNLLARLLANEPAVADVLINSWTYGASKMAVAEAVAAHGGGSEVREVQIRLPVASVQELVIAVGAELDRWPNIRVAVFDHITSTTACIMPVEQLTALCRSRGVKVIIDGAHAIGQISGLNIANIGADFYIGNLNKWHFLPKSVALMWVNESYLESLKPSTTSWMVYDSEFTVRYSYLGTRDTSSFYVIPEAVQFIEDVCGGLDKVHSYCTKLADEASQHLARVWGTNRLPLPETMQAPYMRLIKLPEHLQSPAIKEFMKEFRLGSKMWKYLVNQLNMDLLLLIIEDSIYIRVSASIIVDMDDVRKLADTMMQLKEADFVLFN